MAAYLIKLTRDLRDPHVVTHWPGDLVWGDSEANVVRVTVVMDGEPVQLSGTVVGRILRADGQTLVWDTAPTTWIDGSDAVVLLPASAYSVSGPATLSVALADGDALTTLVSLKLMVNASTSTAEVAPVDTVPNLQQLVAKIAEMEEATEEARDATEDAIAAAAAGVRTDTAAQGLTDTQKSNARTNIAAADKATQNKIDWATKASAIALPSNADLNDYYGADKLGIYSVSSSVSATLVHAPQNSGGAYLLVERASPNGAEYVKQTMIYGKGITFIRHRQNATTWTRWEVVGEYGLAKTAAKVLAANTDVDDLKDTTGFGIYSFTSAVSATLSHMPRSSGGGYLIVESSSPSNTIYVKQTAIYGSGHNYVRTYQITGWSNWTNDNEDLLAKPMAVALPENADLNSYYGADKLGIYSVSSVVSPTLANAPRNSGGAYLIVERASPNGVEYVKQTMIYGAGLTFIRHRQNATTWTRWEYVGEYSLAKNAAKALAANTDVDDLSDAAHYGIYSFTTAVSQTLAHMPRTSGGGYLIVESSTPTGSMYVRQTAMYGGGHTYERYLTGSSVWTQWYNLHEQHDALSVIVPEYWKTELSTTVDTVLTNRLTIGKNDVEFVFITDTHFAQSAKKSPALVGYLQKALGIDRIVCGGDIIYYSAATKFEGLKELQEFMAAFTLGGMMVTIGNHDRNAYTASSARLYDADVYSTLARPMESFGTSGMEVGWFDFTQQKVRFVQFSYSLTSASASTVAAAFNQLPSDWTVVLFTHKYWEANAGGDPIVITEADALFQAIVASEHACTIAAFIVGHVHSDQNTTVSGVPVISTTCDCVAVNLYDGPTMTTGTDTEQAFDIVQLDTVNRKLYFTRVGAGSDRTFSY